MNAVKDFLVPKAHAFEFNFLKSSLTTTQGGSASVTSLASAIINWVLIVAAALAVIYLIYSGIIYITAAGNPDAAKKGQQGVINAIIGIVIIVLAFFIAQAVANVGSNIPGTT